MNTSLPTGFGHRTTTRSPPAFVVAPHEHLAALAESLRTRVASMLAHRTRRASVIEPRDQRAARFDQERARLERERAAERMFRLMAPPH